MLALVALVTVGCSTASLEVDASGTTTSITERSSTTTTTRPATTTSTTTTTTTTTPEPDFYGGSGSGELAGACPTLEDLDGLGLDDADPSASQVAAAFDVLARYVPPELAADLETLRVATMELFAALEAAGDDEEAWLDGEMQAAFEVFADPAVEAAGERIEDYFDRTCPDLDALGGSGEDELGPTGTARD